MRPPARSSSRRSFLNRSLHLARRAALAEVHGYVSTSRFLARRPSVPAGAMAFDDHRPLLPAMIVFIAVSVVELVAVDLIVRRWNEVRIPLVVLSI